MMTLSSQARPFLRHIQAAHNVTLPNERIPLFFQNHLIGYAVPELIPIFQEEIFQQLLSLLPHKILLHKGENLRIISKILEEKKIFQPFHELFDIRLPSSHSQNTPHIIGQIDRALIPLLGSEAEGVHLNGLVHKNNDIYLWVAKRSQNKRLDPGRLDHLVAGGICAGHSPKETLIKEAQEEAGLEKTLTQNAKKTALISYAMLRSEGLRRDKLHCYDLILPENFIPYAADGEVESFSLMALRDVFDVVKETEHFKFNVNLVLIDLFIRYNFFNQNDSTLLRNALFAYPSCIKEQKTT